MTYAPASPSAIPTFDSLQAAVDSALANQFAGTAVEAVDIHGSPPVGAATGPWLNVTVAASDDRAGATMGDWEAALLIGQLRDEMHTSNLPQISGYNIYLSVPDGATELLGGGAPGNVAYGQSFDSSPTSETSAAIENAAAAAGVTVKSVTYVHTLDPSPVIVLESSNPTAFLSAHPDLDQLFKSIGVFEGMYIELVDASGIPAQIEWGAYRTSFGDRWNATDVGDAVPNPSTG